MDKEPVIIKTFVSARDTINVFENAKRAVSNAMVTIMWFAKGHRPWDETIDWDMLVAPRLTTLIRRYDLDAYADEWAHRIRAAWLVLRGKDICE